MKLYQFIIVILSCVCFYNCTREEEIVATELPNKRVQMYDTNSTNKVIKFISQYYYDHDKFMITDPDSSDYLYNFKEKNSKYEVTLPDQTEEHLWKGIEMVKSLLLDAYSTKFIHDHFPYSLIYTDGVMDTEMELEEDYHVGRYFCMIRIQDIQQMTPEEKQQVSAKLHEMVWFYIGIYDEFLQLPSEFYSFAGEYYRYVSYYKAWTKDELYKKGFASNKWEEYDATLLPTKGEDIGSWIGFLLATPENELQDILNTYTPMRIKYGYLVKALEANGIDYRKLKYTEK